LDYIPEGKDPGSSLSKLAGYTFIARHQKVLLQQSLPLDVARRIVSTQEVISPWFDLYTHLVLTYHLIPELTFNCDETALFINDTQVPKAVTHADCLVLPVVTTPDRMPTATVLFTICADSTHLPTIVIWPRKTLPPELKSDTDNIVFLPSSSGWQTKDSLFFEMSTILFPAMEAKREKLGNPLQVILLILDSHSSRCHSPLLTLSRTKKILLLTIPPHSSHILQPDDRGPNAMLKKVFPNQLALATKYLAGNSLQIARQQLRMILLSSVTSSSLSAVPSSFPLPFTPPQSPAHGPTSPPVAPPS
jgi:hypothetical protein